MGAMGKDGKPELNLDISKNNIIYTTEIYLDGFSG